MYAIFFHAHQKIDRAAANVLKGLGSSASVFPSAERIIYFEGKRGPDATRLKKTAGVEQPWHFIDPFDKRDTDLVETILSHYRLLVQALVSGNEEKAAFEAAWLAHALVDGLTPAHHYPYEKELHRLHGDSRQDRKSIKSKFVVSGETKRESVRRSFRVIGPGGLLTTHTMFEAGAFAVMWPLKLKLAMPTAADLIRLEQDGLAEFFLQEAKAIAELKMFDKFLKSGWTPKLARIARRELAPRMVRLVALAWHQAMREAEQAG